MKAKRTAVEALDRVKPPFVEPDWVPSKLRARRIWRHTYIKILDPTEKYGDTQGRYFHTFGVLGDKIRTKTGALKGTPENQQVRKDEWDGNSGSPPDECNSCYTTPAQREALVRRLEYWALWEHFPCPSCGSNYRTWFQSDSDLFDGYNSNTFTFNMLMQNPVGPIIPPGVSRAPGYHTADGEWYPTR